MSRKGSHLLVSIVGPTAVGKTALAIELAQFFKTEIISADSRQFYREISIGTAKPTEAERSLAPHHFIDSHTVKEEYNASDFEKDALKQVEQLFKHHDLVILCGGSGMYLDAVNHGFDQGLPSADEALRKKLKAELETNGIEALQRRLKQLDPAFYKEVDLANSKRLLRAIEVCMLTGKAYSSIRKGKGKERAFKRLKIGLEMDREHLYERINRRVDIMIENGLLEEVKAVQAYQNHNALKTVGYRELFDYLAGKLTFDTAIEKIKINSRRYAKRQMSWFKRDDSIHWFKPTQIEEIKALITTKIKVHEQS